MRFDSVTAYCSPLSKNTVICINQSYGSIMVAFAEITVVFCYC